MNREIICLNIDLLNYKESIARIMEWGENKWPGYVCFANVHMTIEAYMDKKFASQVNNASLVLSDGMPIVKALNFFYRIQQDRIAGMDIMPDLLRLAEINDLKVFFFGTTDELLSRIKVRTEKEFPNLKVVGLFSPPFDRPLNDSHYADMINSSGANLVFVALGCPKQEKWMAENSEKIKAILLGVGGAFPIYAQTAKRAPLFMRKLSMEWFFRLMQEPRRLFFRYLKTNSLFLFLLMKIKLKHIFNKQNFPNS